MLPSETFFFDEKERVAGWTDGWKGKEGGEGNWGGARQGRGGKRKIGGFRARVSAFSPIAAPSFREDGPHVGMTHRTPFRSTGDPRRPHLKFAYLRRIIRRNRSLHLDAFSCHRFGPHFVDFGADRHQKLAPKKLESPHGLVQRSPTKVPRNGSPQIRLLLICPKSLAQPADLPTQKFEGRPCPSGPSQSTVQSNGWATQLSTARHCEALFSQTPRAPFFSVIRKTSAVFAQLFSEFPGFSVCAAISL